MRSPVLQLPRRGFALIVVAALSSWGCQAPEPSTAVISMKAAAFALPRQGAVAVAVPSAAPAEFGAELANGVASAPLTALPAPPAAIAPASPVPPARSGGRAAGGRTTTGTVSALVDGVARALEDAEVRTTDGRQAITDADGRFALQGGPPSDGAYLASHPAFVASMVAGLAGEDPIALHLQAPVLVVTAKGAGAAEASFTAAGRVVDAGGQPLAGVLLVLADVRGAVSNPEVSGPDGSFALVVRAPGGEVVDGTLLAVGTAGRPWAGMATGLDLKAGESTIDLDPATPAADPLVLLPADHRLRVSIATPGIEGRLRHAVELVGPGGVRLGLFDASGERWLAPVPGARYALRAEAIDSLQGLQSSLVRDDLAIDFGKPETTIDETLLSPPAFLSQPSLQPGATLGWSPVAGATGYQLGLASQDTSGLAWEAFTPTSSFPYPFSVPPPAGRYGLTLTAWDLPGVGPRSVASVPRALRVLPVTTSFRRASRQVILSM